MSEGHWKLRGERGRVSAGEDVHDLVVPLAVLRASHDLRVEVPEILSNTKLAIFVLLQLFSQIYELLNAIPQKALIHLFHKNLPRRR